MAFQTGAFQTNAFQTKTGEPDTTPLGTTILDGANDAVSFLEQEAEYLTTLGDSLGQDRDGGDGSFYPTISAVVSGSLAASALNHTVILPTYVAGDSVYIFFTHTKANAAITRPTGWEMVEQASGGDPANAVAVIYKVMDGSEGANLAVATTTASEAVWTSYTIQGAQALEPPMITIAAKVSSILNPDPPNVISTFGASKALWFAGTHMSDGTTTGPENAPSTYPFVESNNFVGQVGTGTFQGLATCSLTTNASTISPAAFTHANSAGSPASVSFTVGIRGLNNDPPNPPQVVPDVYELGLELPDGEAQWQNGVRENDVPQDCLVPIISSLTTTLFDAAATSHLVSMPATVGVRDLLVVIFSGTHTLAQTITTPSGWSLLDDKTQRGGVITFSKVADGSEGGTTVDFVTSAAAKAVAVSFAVQYGTYNTNIPTAVDHADSGASATWDAPSVTFLGNENDAYLYVDIGSQFSNSTTVAFSSYPAGYTDYQANLATSGASPNVVIAISATSGTSPTVDPPTGAWSAASTSSGTTLIIRGACGVTPIYSDQAPDDSYGWDDTDYGTQSDPQIEDVFDGIGSGGPDDSEYLIDDADYGFEQDPVGDDADLAQSIWSDGNNVEDPTWTDTTDYSTQSDPLAPDADLAQSIFDNGTNVEDPYFTDFTDYGTQTAPLSEDFPQDFLLGLDDGTNLEDPTGADWFEYGFDAEPLSEDFPQDFPQALIDDGNTVEDATYTDWTEYGTQTDVSLDDINTTQEDFLLGIDSGNDQFDDPTQTDQADYGTQSDPQIDDADLGQSIIEDGNTRDDTDYADYGTQTDSLSPDFPEDFVLGISDGTNLEDPTGADWFEYGTQTDPLADDVDLAQSIIDSGNNVEDPTGTDFTDYGAQSDPLADDVDLAQGIIDCGTNVEDPSFTDFTDYGTKNDPLSPDAPEDQILGIDDGTNLDDPTQTDRADYGTQSDILLFLQEDFSLGTGDGLDYQDFTDTADYSFAQDCVDNAASGVVLVPVTGVLITVQVGCFHSYGFGDIPDPSTAWTPASSSSTSWSTVSDPGNPGWSTLTDGSTSWSGITDPSDPGWTEDC